MNMKIDLKMEVWCYIAVMLVKDADRMANSVDPDQTASFRSSLIWVCTVCTDQTAPLLGILWEQFVLLMVPLNK